LRPDEIRSILLLTALDCYDRKIEREKFAEILDMMGKGFTLCRSIEVGVCAMKVLAAHDPERAPQALSTAVDQNISAISHLRQNLMDKMQQVALCPWDHDKIS
jgi:hypothetical protein